MQQDGSDRLQHRLGGDPQRPLRCALLFSEVLVGRVTSMCTRAAILLSAMPVSDDDKPGSVSSALRATVYDICAVFTRVS